MDYIRFFLFGSCMALLAMALYIPGRTRAYTILALIEVVMIFFISIALAVSK